MQARRSETMGMCFALEHRGLSNAMIEAMANGVVPIASKISGFVDHIVPGHNGFFLRALITLIWCKG